MATYYYKYSWLEDGYGEVEHLVTISDSYNGLFDLTDASEITNFEIDGINKKINKLVGGIIESQMNFAFHNHVSNNANETALYNLIMTAKDPSVNVYMAKFINTGMSPLADNLHFYGVVKSDFETEDIFWYGNSFGSIATPIHTVKGTATPYLSTVVESISLQELIDDIDTTWESNYVADRQGYFSWAAKNRQVKVSKLVSLNALIRKLASNLSLRILQDGLGIVNFIFAKSVIDGNCHPARWVHSKNINYLPEGDNSIKYPRFNYCRRSNLDYKGEEVTQNFYSNESQRGEVGFQVYATDKKQIFIDPDNNPNPDTNNSFPEEAFFINYRMVKNDSTDSLYKENEQFQITSKCKNFYEFLEKIAITFGMYLLIEPTTNNSIKISFVARSNFANSDTVYLRTPTKAGVKLSNNVEESTNDIYSIKANSICDDGQKYYIKKANQTGAMTVSKFDDNSKNSNSANILFSIAPTTVVYSEWYNQSYIPSDDGRLYTLVVYPHNTYMANNNVKQNFPYAHAEGLHTALYMYVSKVTDPNHFVYYADEFSTPEYYYTPLGAISIEIDGVTHLYRSTTEFLKGVLELDSKFIYYEYNVDIPSYFGFSENTDGTNKDWKLADVGKQVVIDGQQYTMVEVSWDSKEPLVKLKLHGTEKFNFSNPIDVAIEENNTSIEQPPINTPLPQMLAGIAEEAISYLQAVVVDNELISVATAFKSNCFKKIAIATNSADIENSVGYVTSGVVTIPDEWADLEVGKKVFLKYVDANTNISQIAPQPGNALNEDLFLEIGVAKTVRSIELYEDFPQRYVYSAKFWENNNL